MNLVPYAIPFFILAMLVEWRWGVRVKRNTYRLADTINSLQLGTLSQLQGLLHIGIASTVYGFVASRLSRPSWPSDSIAVWVVAFVAYDLCYYWSHRLGHEWKLLWAAHAAHHQSEEFNLSTALRQTSTGYLTFVFYIPLFVVGVPASVIVTVGSLNLIYQFWVHTEHIRRLGFLEWVFVTPSNHRVHHAKNPRYIDRNYGGVFIVWDRLFGTFEDERADEPCRYGTTAPLASWNPLWANVQVWLDTARASVATRRFRDKVSLWFSGPGVWPADVTHEAHDWQAQKFSPPTSPFALRYAFVQYWCVTALGLTLVATAPQLDRTFVLVALALLAGSLYVQGTWLENRPYAAMLEWFRLVLVATFVVACGGSLGALLIPIAIYLGASALALLIATNRGYTRVSLMRGH